MLTQQDQKEKAPLCAKNHDKTFVCSVLEKRSGAWSDIEGVVDDVKKSAQLVFGFTVKSVST